MPTTYPLPAVCSQQQVAETRPEYAARVLRFVLDTRQTGMLTCEQLEQADQAAQRAAANLPTKLDEAHARIAQRLTDTRHQLAAALRWRKEQHAAAEAQHQEAQAGGQDDPGDDPGPGGDQKAETDADRAVRLLRAALTLIVTPPRRDQDGGGGQGARLIAPRPTLPTGGIALTQPGRTPRPGDAIDF